MALAGHTAGSRLSITFDVQNKLESTMFKLANMLGMAVYLPLLFATAMSFDAPGSGKHWSHWFFVLSALSLGPLGFAGYKAQRFRGAGLCAFAIFAFSIFILEVVCNGKFTCS